MIDEDDDDSRVTRKNSLNFIFSCFYFTTDVFQHCIVFQDQESRSKSKIQIVEIAATEEDNESATSMLILARLKERLNDLHPG